MYRFLSALMFVQAVAVADITTLPTGSLEWQTTPEGVAFAALDGDRFAGEYMAMVSLPHGLVSPAHVKSADMFGVVISGAMTHVPAGASPHDGKLLTAGAYYHIPAGVAHVSSCLSASDCVTFLFQPGAFDFVTVSQ